MSENHNHDHNENKLLNAVNRFKKDKVKLTFTEFESSNEMYNIKHKALKYENVPLDSELTFEDMPDNSNSEVIMNLGGYKTEMMYISGFDIFVGYKTYEKQTFQLILRIVEFAEKDRLEISYHNINTPSGSAVNHDGTIHPIE